MESSFKTTKMNPKIEPFERYADRYDRWFEENCLAYLSELKGLKELIPEGEGIEIGVGTGRFCKPLGIDIGMDPSLSMLKKAKNRGIKVFSGVAEELPIASNIFDYVLLTTTICFVDDLEKTFKECWRILKTGGFILLGFIDSESPLGMSYIYKKDKNPFYSEANFYSTNYLLNRLKKIRFCKPEVKQTLSQKPHELKKLDDVKDGYGKGSFIIVRMRKEG